MEVGPQRRCGALDVEQLFGVIIVRDKRSKSTIAGFVNDTHQKVLVEFKT